MVIWRLRTKCNHCTIDYAYESQKTCTPSYNQHSLACNRTPSKEDVVALLVIGQGKLQPRIFDQSGFRDMVAKAPTKFYNRDLKIQKKLEIEVLLQWVPLLQRNTIEHKFHIYFLFYIPLLQKWVEDSLSVLLNMIFISPMLSMLELG